MSKKGLFLTHGVNQHNELISIEEVERGKTALGCPYCGRGLIARKGRVLAHHFAHDGESCREVAGRDPEALALPLYDRFHIHLSGEAWRLLQNVQQGYGYGRLDAEWLESLGLVRFNLFAGRMGDWDLTDLGKIPFGLATLPKFAAVQRESVAKRHHELETYLASHREESTALVDLQIYRAQLRRVLTAALYFIEVKYAGGILYKVGITTRPLAARLAEIERVLHPHLGKVKLKRLRRLAQQGSVEHYFKFRYREHAHKLETLTEYFTFESRRQVLSDLTRLGKRELDEFEAAVAAGEPSPAEAEVLAERAERERSQQIRAGMARAAAAGTHVGRPSGSGESQARFLEKHAAVVAALDEGLSLRRAAAVAGVSVNTIRKVKATLASMGKNDLTHRNSDQQR